MSASKRPSKLRSSGTASSQVDPWQVDPLRSLTPGRRPDLGQWLDPVRKLIWAGGVAGESGRRAHWGLTAATGVAGVVGGHERALASAVHQRPAVVSLAVVVELAQPVQ